MAVGVALFSINKDKNSTQTQHHGTSGTRDVVVGSSPTTLSDLIDVACHTTTRRSSNNGRSRRSSSSSSSSAPYIQCNDYLWTSKDRTMYSSSLSSSSSTSSTTTTTTTSNKHRIKIIKRGMKLFEVPRTSQITVVDAIRHFYNTFVVDVVDVKHNSSSSSNTSSREVLRRLLQHKKKKITGYDDSDDDDDADDTNIQSSSSSVLDPRAYLAWYLAVLKKKIQVDGDDDNNNNIELFLQQQQHTSTSATSSSGPPPSDLGGDDDNSNNQRRQSVMTRHVSDYHQTYLRYLPTYEDFESFHPMFFFFLTSERSDHSTSTSHGHNSSSSSSLRPLPFLEELLIQRWTNEFESEWKVFEKLSSLLVTTTAATETATATTATTTTTKTTDDTAVITLSKREYLTARLWVSTRSFTGGVPTQLEVSDLELKQWQQIGILFQDSTNIRGDYNNNMIRSKLTSTMVPLLDSLDHSVKPNVGWKADLAGDGSNSFTVFAATDFDDLDTTGEEAKGTNIELKDTYGLQTPESWIYAQYGFASTISSEQQATRKAALFSIHTIHDFLLEQETDQIIQDQEQQLNELYLLYNDGHKNCSNMEQGRNKFARLKLMVLQRLYANSYNKWVATVPPQDHDQSSIAGLPSLNEAPPKVDSGIAEIVKTCRLLALTHHDYGGTATEMLQKALSLEKESARKSFSLPSPISSSSSSSSSQSQSLDNLALEYRTWVWVERLALLRLLNSLGPNNHAIQTSSSSGSTTGPSILEISEAVLREHGRILQQIETTHGRSHPSYTKLFVQIGELQTTSVVGRYAYHKHSELRTMIVKQKRLENKNDYEILEALPLMTTRSEPCDIINSS